MATQFHGIPISADLAIMPIHPKPSYTAWKISCCASCHVTPVHDAKCVALGNSLTNDTVIACHNCQMVLPTPYPVIDWLYFYADRWGHSHSALVNN